MTNNHDEIRIALSRTSRFPANRIVKIPARKLRSLLADHDMYKARVELYEHRANIQREKKHEGPKVARSARDCEV